jgi:hypothetical protein
VDDRPWAGPTHPAAAYIYCDGRQGEHPIAHLAAFRGILQVDGYAGYGKLVKARTDGSIQLAFCWVHARRLFYEFFTSTQSPLAAEVLARIAKLYAIEAEIRGQPADDALIERGIQPGSLTTIWWTLRRLGLTHKKSAARGRAGSARRG